MVFLIRIYVIMFSHVLQLSLRLILYYFANTFYLQFLLCSSSLSDVCAVGGALE